ncbi:chaperone protein DnaJ, putative [Perkinsus marinus ATCC 50983]|uniref:Chaperone protein DnaJ, putative n=1 Tax=Perkinsus marinus (strain ATCC 50983 / TXsc) TaxID=423536 RepID=C5L2Z9_PERM5|nr:chaperone protein DnaJ, putative [Perkinsus marinus ATCC 50983]EER08886.1 chaperone protein DnaJ, putative [Perkinsus marinus ATCC 50983]|eukprot:XP_002777070.1 chaperone protein DnaJ, putative [Perkinsus marinus ATCC 50983]
MSISAEAQPEVFSTELVGAVGDIPFGTRSLKLPDYYAVLDVPRAASQSEICNGYRFSALKWHPDKYPESSRVHAASQFQLAAEAYSVLNDSQSRLVYDRYGHEGLLYGVAGTVLEGSPVKVDAMEVYEAFFGSYSPFADLIREKQESIKTAAESQGPAANRVLDITLREAVAGVTKVNKLLVS